MSLLPDHIEALFAKTPQEPSPTARQIIEARLGRKLPPIPDMRPDEREAVKRLAIQLIRNKRSRTP